MPTLRCPICHDPLPRPAAHHPFCSERCQFVDLGKWLGGDYTIPGRRPEDQASTSDIDEQASNSS